MSNFCLKDPKGRNASVPDYSPYEPQRNEAAVLVGEMALARISTAHEGIRSIVTILQQRETDMEMDGEVLALSTATVTGLLNALACCADFAEMYATGADPGHTRRLERAEHIAAMQAAEKAAKRGEAA
jgi:hypothetical protein